MYKTKRLPLFIRGAVCFSRLRGFITAKRLPFVFDSKRLPLLARGAVGSSRLRGSK